MFLQKKKLKGPDIGDIVEVEYNKLSEINKKYSLKQETLDIFEKYILVGFIIVDSVKYARLIKIKVNYSKGYNTNFVQKRKDFQLIDYSYIIPSRTSYYDAFAEGVNDVINFLKEAYGFQYTKG